MMDYNRLKDAVYGIKADDSLENRVLAGIYEKTAVKGRRGVPGDWRRYAPRY